MSWADQRARLLRKAPVVERLPFTPGFPHFVQRGPNTWVETPYATAHCVFGDDILAENDRIFCAEHCRQMEAL